MSDELNDELESTTEPTEEVENTDEVEETDDQLESEDLEAIKEKNKRLFERAKKAEAEAKLLKAERQKREEQAKAKVEAKAKTEPVEKQTGYDLEDVAVLVSKVSDKEDREFVKKSAKLLGVTLEEALGDPIVQGKLKERAEQRQTAEATNTGTARRGSAKPNLDKVYADASEGKLPDDPELLAEAHFNKKLKK